MSSASIAPNRLLQVSSPIIKSYRGSKKRVNRGCYSVREPCAGQPRLEKFRLERGERNRHTNGYIRCREPPFDITIVRAIKMNLYSGYVSCGYRFHSVRRKLENFDSIRYRFPNSLGNPVDVRSVTYRSDRFRFEVRPFSTRVFRSL